MPRNPKHCESSKDGPHFSSPRGPKIHAKSKKNRLQEPSMLRSILHSQKNASRSLPGGLLSASCNINQIFGGQLGLQIGTENPRYFDTSCVFVETPPGTPKLSLVSPNLSPKSEQKLRFLELVLASNKGRSLLGTPKVACTH